jgi:hypothetical protein
VLIDSCLFRLAAEIEVRQHTPLLQRLNLLNNETRYLIGDSQKLLSPASGIGENDHEEDGWRATPVVSQGGRDVDNVRREAPGGAIYCGLEQGLFRESPWELHESIIARLDSDGEMTWCGSDRAPIGFKRPGHGLVPSRFCSGHALLDNRKSRKRRHRSCRSEGHGYSLENHHRPSFRCDPHRQTRSRGC